MTGPLQVGYIAHMPHIAYMSIISIISIILIISTILIISMILIIAIILIISIGALYRAFCGIPGILGGARSMKVMEGLSLEERWGRLY